MTRLIVVDTETDGPDAATANMLEIAVASLDLDTGNVDLVWDSLVRPPDVAVMDWDGFFLSRCGLTPDDFHAAPSFAEQLPVVLSLFKRGPVTSYNTRFDMELLRSYGVVPSHTCSCIMQSCVPILKLPGRIAGTWKWPRLEEAWQYLFPGVELGESHRAAPDAVAAAKIAYELHKMGCFTVTP